MRFNFKDVGCVITHEGIGVHHWSDPNAVKTHALSWNFWHGIALCDQHDARSPNVFEQRQACQILSKILGWKMRRLRRAPGCSPICRWSPSVCPHNSHPQYCWSSQPTNRNRCCSTPEKGGSVRTMLTNHKTDVRKPRKSYVRISTRKQSRQISADLRVLFRGLVSTSSKAIHHQEINRFTGQWKPREMKRSAQNVLNEVPKLPQSTC